MNRSTERNSSLCVLTAGAFVLALSLAACGQKEKAAEAPPPKPAQETPKVATPAPEVKQEPAPDASGTMPVKPSTPPDRVEVQHILIGFAGSVPGKSITRTQEEANKLAHEILDRARKGEDFGALVREYTDDRPPGIYGMVASGLTPNPGEFPRDGMVPAFGNVGFNISPGNIDIAEYDKASSPFGWHIIKRIK
jgi:hypothetical protein